MSNSKKRIQYLKLLLFIPLFTYCISYLYLALYHSEIFLFSTIIHEGGIYTFTETLFYASHFVGHLPVHIVLAFYFTGVFICLNDPSRVGIEKKHLLTPLLGLISLTAFGFVLSFVWFGSEDTMAFLLQTKQSVVRYEQGGSWNLHLPSTMMQFILIPVYIYVAKIVFKSKIAISNSGIFYIVISLSIFLFMTWLVNEDLFSRITFIWEDPRYLGHSVRELLTFPVTYYTVPLYFFIKNSKRNQHVSIPGNKVLTNVILLLGIIFTILFAYQSIIPLSEGIGELAQTPDFAKGGKLSIPYLLSSHYFEHFLEATFFILLSLTLYYLNEYLYTAKKNKLYV